MRLSALVLLVACTDGELVASDCRGGDTLGVAWRWCLESTPAGEAVRGVYEAGGRLYAHAPGEPAVGASAMLTAEAGLWLPACDEDPSVPPSMREHVCGLWD